MDTLEDIKTAVEEFSTTAAERFDAQDAVIETLKADLAERETAAPARGRGRITEPDDLPGDAPRRETRSRRHTAIGADDRETRKALTEFARVLRGEIEVKTMSVGVDPAGGSMVPTQIDNRILDQLIDISPIRQIAEIVQTVSSDYVKLVNRRGTTSGWAGENTSRATTDTPDISEIKPPSGELYARPAVTSWLLDDAQFNVDQFINDNVSMEFSFQESAAFVVGDGVNKPRGFTTYSTVATGDATRAFGTLEHLAAASSTAIDPDELIQLLYLLKPAYRQGPSVSWVMNSTTASAIRQLKDSQNRYLWTDGLQPGQPASLLGYRVTEAEDMVDAATGTLPVAFGNWGRGYLIADRVGTRVVRDEVTTPGQVRFYFAKRVGGAITDSNAVKFLKMA